MATYHHHHHWLDSPWWSLAFLRSFAHSSLLRANFFQFLTPNILISWSTPSSHRNFGLPPLLAPSGLVLNILLIVLSLSIRTKCPAHASLLTLIQLTMFDSLNISYSSYLYLFRHVPFFCFAPKTHRSTFLSNRLSRRSLVLDKVRVSEAYVRTWQLISSNNLHAQFYSCQTTEFALGAGVTSMRASYGLQQHFQARDLVRASWN